MTETTEPIVTRAETTEPPALPRMVRKATPPPTRADADAPPTPRIGDAVIYRRETGNPNPLPDENATVVRVHGNGWIDIEISWQYTDVLSYGRKLMGWTKIDDRSGRPPMVEAGDIVTAFFPAEAPDGMAWRHREALAEVIGAVGPGRILARWSEPRIIPSVDYSPDGTAPNSWRYTDGHADRP